MRRIGGEFNRFAFHTKHFYRQARGQVGDLVYHVPIFGEPIRREDKLKAYIAGNLERIKGMQAIIEGRIQRDSYFPTSAEPYRVLEGVSDSALNRVNQQLEAQPPASPDDVRMDADIRRLTSFLWALDNPQFRPDLDPNHRQALITWRDETVHVDKMEALGATVDSINVMYPQLKVKSKRGEGIGNTLSAARATIFFGADLLIQGAISLGVSALWKRTGRRAITEIQPIMVYDDGEWLYADHHQWRYVLQHENVKRTKVLESEALNLGRLNVALEESPQVVTRFIQQLFADMPRETFREMYEPIAAYEVLNYELSNRIIPPYLPVNWKQYAIRRG